MGNFKRNRSRKQTRACRMCKYYKFVGVTERADGERFSDHKRRAFAGRDAREES